MAKEEKRDFLSELVDLPGNIVKGALDVPKGLAGGIADVFRAFGGEEGEIARRRDTLIKQNQVDQQKSIFAANAITNAAKRPFLSEEDDNQFVISALTKGGIDPKGANFSEIVSTSRRKRAGLTSEDIAGAAPTGGAASGETKTGIKVSATGAPRFKAEDVHFTDAQGNSQLFNVTSAAQRDQVRSLVRQAGGTIVSGAPSPQEQESGSSIFSRTKNRFTEEFLNPNTTTERRQLLKGSGILGGSGTTVNVNTGDTFQSADAQIKRIQTMQEAANRFNENSLAPNQKAVVKTDSKGNNVIALEGLGTPTSEERSQKVLLDVVRSSMDNIATVAGLEIGEDGKFKSTGKLGRTGPIEGTLTNIRTKLIGGDPSGAQLQNELTSLIMTVYALSGKQINENEFKVHSKMMPSIFDPDDTFISNYNTFLGRLKTLSGIREDLWEKLGLSTTKSSKEDAAKAERRKKFEDFKKRRGQ